MKKEKQQEEITKPPKPTIPNAKYYSHNLGQINHLLKKWNLEWINGDDYESGELYNLTVRYIPETNKGTLESTIQLTPVYEVLCDIPFTDYIKGTILRLTEDEKFLPFWSRRHKGNSCQNLPLPEVHTKYVETKMMQKLMFDQKQLHLFARSVVQI